MANKLSWFPFFASDWLGSTKIAIMTPEEEGGYVRLLAHAWNSPDCTLPINEAELAALARFTRERWEDVRAHILGCFEVHPSKPNRFHNVRLTEIRKQQEDSYSRHAKAGRKGGYSKAKASPKPGYSPAVAGASGSGSVSSSPEEESDDGPEQELTLREREFKGEVAQLAIAWIRGRGEKVNKTTAMNKIQAAVDVGVKIEDIRKAFKAARGEKIWDILDPLREKVKKDRNGRGGTTPSCLNCGGTGKVAGSVVDGKVEQVPCVHCENRARIREITDGAFIRRVEG